MKLEDLHSVEFIESIGFVSTPESLRRALYASPLVHGLRRLLSQGRITEPGIARFVASLMADFRPHVQFPHELALAAVAVILEQRMTSFAEDYLLNLARLSGKAEVHLAPRVAGICLRDRQTRNRVVRKSMVANRLTEYWQSEMKVVRFAARAGVSKRSFNAETPCHG